MKHSVILLPQMVSDIVGISQTHLYTLCTAPFAGIGSFRRAGNETSILHMLLCCTG